jgi:hypothetical protein
VPQEEEEQCYPSSEGCVSGERAGRFWTAGNRGSANSETGGVNWSTRTTKDGGSEVGAENKDGVACTQERPHPEVLHTRVPLCKVPAPEAKPVMTSPEPHDQVEQALLEDGTETP